MKVLAFGEILWDLIDGQPYLGGAPFNFAAHFARCGNQSFLVSSVGNDNLGWRALSEAGRLGVDCTYVNMHTKAPTGTVDVYLNKGEPDYTIIENVAFDEIRPLEELYGQPKAFDILYMGTLCQRNAVSAGALRRIIDTMKFKHVFYDVNLRKNTWTTKILHDTLGSCTILKLNKDEVPVVGSRLIGEKLDTESFCRKVVARYENISLVIVTAAADGCFLFDTNNYSHVPGFQVETVDAIGAGDAFSAVFMHTYSLTGDPMHAARVANRIGAFVASSRGAIPDYPDEILDVLKTAKLR
ncbi:MAG TPA: carbohydrate kinase [Cyclobacteriaceae bacterium]|nr:carbohydrate kinase [Cyclobacteriaceae bacterium]